MNDIPFIELTGIHNSYGRRATYGARDLRGVLAEVNVRLFVTTGVTDGLE